MIIEFKTKRNTNGHRNYLRIDTDKKEYSTFCHSMVMDGIEIKATDRKILINELKENGFTENDKY